MTIEVKQLIVNSSVDSGGVKEPKTRDAQLDLESLKEELLAECRQFLEENLSIQRER